MSPFMTVEVLMTESTNRDERKHQRYADRTQPAAPRERRSHGPARPRRSLRSLFHGGTWASRSV